MVLYERICHIKWYQVMFDNQLFIPVVGSWDLYETFLAGYNLVKKSDFQNTSTGWNITSLDIWHSNISVRSTLKGDIFLLKLRPFWYHVHIEIHLGPFCTRIYIIIQHFSVLKTSKKDENMMSCTRLDTKMLNNYIDPLRLVSN